MSAHMSDPELYEIHCGGRSTVETYHFWVVAADIGKAMIPVFERFGAKTMDDIPKPFAMIHIKDVTFVGPKKRKR